MTSTQSLRIKPSQDSLNLFDTRSTTSSTPSYSTISEEVDDKAILYEITLAAIYKLPVSSIPKEYDSPPSIPSYLLDENDGSKNDADNSSKNSNTSKYQHLMVAKGKFQIFKMLGQSAAYFKCGQFVHPILPKMRMWRIMFSDFVFPQPSPGKYWRLKMFDLSRESADLLEIILFECCYFQSMYTLPRQPSPPPLKPEIYEKNVIETEPRPVENETKDQEFKPIYDVLDSDHLLEKCNLDLLGFPLTPELPESCIDSDSTTETLANSVNGDTDFTSEFDFTRPEIQTDTTIADPLIISNTDLFLAEKEFNNQFYTEDGKEALEDFPYLSPTLAEINNIVVKDNDAECAASTSSCSTLDLILDSFDDLPVNHSSSQAFSKERLVHYEQDLIFHKQADSNLSNILVQVHHHHHHYCREFSTGMQQFSPNKALFKSPHTSWEPISKTKASRSFSVNLFNTPLLAEETKSVFPVNFLELQKEVPTANEVLSPLITTKTDTPMKFSLPSVGKRSKSFSTSKLLEPFQFGITGSTVGIRNYSKPASTATTATHLKNSSDSPLLGSWNTVVSQSLPWGKLNLNAIYKNSTNL